MRRSPLRNTKSSPRLDDYVELLNLIDYQTSLIKRQSSIISELTIKLLEQDTLIQELMRSNGNG